VYFDNLTLSIEGVVPTKTTTWASVKKLYR
jgi:hypothetical protein